MNSEARSLPTTGAARYGAGDADLTIMVAAHDAFRRDTLLRRRDRSRVSYISVNAMFAGAFAPVVELLTGA